MTSPIKLALIYGSAREGRFCETVARWTAAQIVERDRFALDVIDPAILAISALGGRSDAIVRAALSERIGEADAFVVVTPEYNHSFPAPLKQLIDSVSEEWRAKPVAFVSYGGISGGLRAVEHLRHVFAELHAVTVRDTVSFANAWSQFDVHGALNDPTYANAAMKVMLQRLSWWANALSAARAVEPYADAA